MEQKFLKNSILGRAKRPSRADIKALREFCERRGSVVAYTAIILVFTLMVAHAEGRVNWKPLLNAVEFSEHNFVDTIRVKVEKGAVIVPVEIAGKERHLLFRSQDGTEKRVAIARTE